MSFFNYSHADLYWLIYKNAWSNFTEISTIDGKSISISNTKNNTYRLRNANDNNEFICILFRGSFNWMSCKSKIIELTFSILFHFASWIKTTTTKRKFHIHDEMFFISTIVCIRRIKSTSNDFYTKNVLLKLALTECGFGYSTVNTFHVN